jgi:hypothetical protein
MNVFERLRKTRRSYNYCGICGHVPQRDEEPNYAPLRWWDCDDGWKIGTLCSWCAQEALPRLPQPSDFAFSKAANVADDVNTDEDPLEAI